MYIAVPRAGGLPDVNVNKFDIYCYVGLCPAMRYPTPLMIPQKLEVHTKELYSLFKWCLFHGVGSAIGHSCYKCGPFP